MRKKRIMIIGAGRSGKSSLGRWLDQEAAAWDSTAQEEAAGNSAARRGTAGDSAGWRGTAGDSAGWRAAAGDLWSRRTPALVYRGNIMEAPGAYLESPWMRHHLIAAAQDAFCVLMLVDFMGKRDIYPPGFAKVFRQPVLGVVTKCSLIQADDGRFDNCRKQLARAGVREPYLITSVVDGIGLEALCREVMDCRTASGIDNR